jgi:hypothetical protein
MSETSIILWATKKRAPAGKKHVLLIRRYLWNYSSNFKILKSLTQLFNWATQKYHPKQHTAYVLLVRSPQKMSTFSEILFFGKNHAVLEVQHLQPSINGKSCAPTGTEGYPKPKKAQLLRFISQQSPKKGHFYYIRTQVFAAY